MGYTHAHLHKFLRDPARRGRRLQIGTYTFYLNPDSIESDTQRQHLEVTTVGGGLSFRFPAMPTVWTFTGHTGVMGADELEKMRGVLEPGPKPETLLPFRFPGMFLGTVYVLVHRFRQSMRQTSPLYTYFDVEVLVLPKQRPPSYTRIASTEAATGTAAPQPRPFGNVPS